MTHRLLRIEQSFPPVTRATLALYAGASGDINLVHIDSDAARAAGFDDVFAQGMLAMAYMGRAVTDAVPPHRLRSFSSRFIAITRLGDGLTCTGIAGSSFTDQGERRFLIELELRSQAGELKLSGRAICAVEEDGDDEQA